MMLGGSGGGFVKSDSHQILDLQRLASPENNTHSALRKVVAMLKTVAENINAFYKGSENSSQS